MSSMLMAPLHLLRLYKLAVTMRRHGALRALKQIEAAPDGLTSFLRMVTFFIPRKRKLKDDDGARLADAFAAMGPSYIKLGQTLAMRPDLIGVEIATGLSRLQDNLPPFDTKIAVGIIETELGGSLDELFQEFNMEPIAAASIAQVHKARTLEGQEVAVKVLRPDIQKRFARDLSTFRWVAKTAERFSPEARRLRPFDIVRTVEKSVHDEMDMRLEAAAAAQLAHNMEGQAGYRIPAVNLQCTSEKVLTTEWIDGIRISDIDALKDAGIDLPDLGSRVVQIFLTQAMRDGYFHADLHKGNLLVEADGIIAAVDFGIMGRLDRNSRRFLAEILYGFIQRDYHYVAEVHFEAGYVPRHHSLEEFAQALRAIADPIMDLPVEQISAGNLLTQLFATTARFEMKTRPELLLLQRSMVMAEGMALHLNPSAVMWHLSEPVIAEWMRDNLSPEVQLADAITGIPGLFKRLLRQMEEAAETRDNVPAGPVEAGRGGMFTSFVAGAAFAMALVALLS